MSSETLGYLWPSEVGFMSLCQFVFEWEHVEKVLKILLSAQRQNEHFVKNIKTYLILTKNCNQNPWPTMNQKASLDRQWPNLSSGTLEFEICPPIRSQWPWGNDGPLMSVLKIEWYMTSTSSSLFLAQVTTKWLCLRPLVPLERCALCWIELYLQGLGVQAVCG